MGKEMLASLQRYVPHSPSTYSKTNTLIHNTNDIFYCLKTLSFNILVSNSTELVAVDHSAERARKKLMYCYERAWSMTSWKEDLGACPMSSLRKDVEHHHHDSDALKDTKITGVSKNNLHWPETDQFFVWLRAFLSSAPEQFAELEAALFVSFIEWRRIKMRTSLGTVYRGRDMVFYVNPTRKRARSSSPSGMSPIKKLTLELGSLQMAGLLGQISNHGPI
ncbi:hypothetical protein BKA62DRAFT_675217 [Auriculariales sp. MPI-PUGE-AT-0066]|nr:hypothetical protein BKA62DRAFT_675217 [Auriculariales sp. MPI-PUGE-AT-0066]